MNQTRPPGGAAHVGAAAGGGRNLPPSPSASITNQSTASTPGPGSSDTCHFRMEMDQCSLIDEIRFIDPEAVDELNKKRLTTNCEIEGLSDEALKQLFPKDKNGELRFQIKELIKIFKQSGYRARTVAGPYIETGYRAGTVAEPHIETGHGTSLMDQIRHISGDAVNALQEAEITTETEIQNLTREDLIELLPGHKNLKLRKIISERIKKSLQVDIVVNRTNCEKHSDEHMRADLNPNPASDESLKEQMNKVMSFLQVLRNQLKSDVSSLNAALGEGLTTLKEIKDLLQSLHHQPESCTGNNTQAAAFKSTSKWSWPNLPYMGWPSSASTSAYDKPSKQMKRAVVKVHCVVSGKTLGSHQTLLQQVKAQGGLELQQTNNPDTCDVIILFCPIVSRMGTDIEAAMKMVPGVGNKVIIRVLLHHTFNEEYTVPHVSADSRVKYDVSALFHDTKGGLLLCEINNQAVQQIHSALLMYRSTGYP